MKATGIVRRVDDLGRIVIPKEIRRSLQIHEDSLMEILVEEDSIVLSKYDKTPSIEEDAKKWLHSMKSVIDRQRVHFSIVGNTTVCTGISGNNIITGSSICNSQDTFSPYIGMVYAYCRAFNITLPDFLE